jgi:ABC-type antimicrobial peptide transport system permease subunit
MNKKPWLALLVLVFITLACEPMIAIGRYEFLILIVLIGLLLGPPAYRFARKVEDFLKHTKKE